MNRAALIAQAELAHAAVGGLLGVLGTNVGLTEDTSIHSPEWHLDAAASCLRQAQAELKQAATAAVIELEHEDAALAA